MPCPAECGYTGNNLEYHFRHSPYCKPVKQSTDPKQSKKRVRDCAASARVYDHQVTTRIGIALLQAKTDKYVKTEHLDIVRNLMVQVVGMAVIFIKNEHNMGDVDIDTILESAYSPFKNLPPAATMIEQRRKVYQRAIPRPIGGGEFDSENKKGAIRFDAYQLITIILQECQGARIKADESSELWKTGTLFGKAPNIVSDITHDSRFYNWWEVCGEATQEQAKDFRVVLHAWIDAYTPLDGLSQRARKHKYTVMLGSMVNLPVRMRHYHDFLLLLLLYNDRYMKKHGGLVRALTGTGTDGTVYDDDANLAMELDLPEGASPWIQLPNDEDPSGSPVSRRLRIFLLVVSYDWLGGGEFGPWAESVSARHPCFKCMWTPACPCAYLAASDPSRATVEHVEYCQQNAPRTHDAAMQVITELRALARKPRSKTAVENRMKVEGIFSLYCASDRLMRDVVRDATLDSMHWGPCGKTRYLFSWLTDIIIPKIFSWDQLNQKKNAHRFRKGARVPDLERSKGDKRGSTSTHLSSGEMLNFALASPQIMEELVAPVKDDPPWQCWLAHVTHLRFVNRRAFDLQRDVPECSRLQQNFLLAFGRVEEWSERGKPKFHLGDHFGDELGELGPFRNFNCLWGEAYVQVMKAMFRITNYKSAPYDVAVHWATKSVMHYRDPLRGTWYEDVITPTTEFYFDLRALRSPLADALIRTDPRIQSLRFASEFRRGPEVVCLNDWIIADKPAVPSMAARVDTIAQITYADEAASYIRIWCTQGRPLAIDDEFAQWSDCACEPISMLVKLESTQVRAVTCTVESTRFVFN